MFTKGLDPKTARALLYRLCITPSARKLFTHQPNQLWDLLEFSEVFPEGTTRFNPLEQQCLNYQSTCANCGECCTRAYPSPAPLTSCCPLCLTTFVPTIASSGLQLWRTSEFWKPEYQATLLTWCHEHRRQYHD